MRCLPIPLLYVAAIDMLLELMNDNKAQVQHMRAAHELGVPFEDAPWPDQYLRGRWR